MWTSAVSSSKQKMPIYTYRPAGAQYRSLVIFYKHSAPLGLLNLFFCGLGSTQYPYKNIKYLKSQLKQSEIVQTLVIIR